MSVRRLPVRPDLEQLQRQAKELLRAIHGGDADAIAELRAHHPAPIDPQMAKLADAQLTLARKYGASSWTRLAHAARLADAIWQDDIESVRAIVTGNPALLHEPVLIDPHSNWGPPMTYAANLGRNAIIRMLHDEARFTRLLLDRGADPNVRASLRARLEEGHGGGPLREYRDVTALGWGERYDAKIFVSRESLRLIEARGGRR